MGVITGHEGAVSKVAAVPRQGSPAGPAGPATAGGAVMHRRSPLATRRCVLYVLCGQDPFVAEDLVTWYTERGFHFCIADLRDSAPLHNHDGFPELDAATLALRGTDGAEMIVISGHGAGALTAALWCDARRQAGRADAVILCAPHLGRELRRGLDIACPALVMCPAAGDGAPAGRAPGLAARLAAGLRRAGGSIRLGSHVTWLQLEAGLPGQAPDGGDGRREFFDEMGRWLGAYMYRRSRDQLL